MRRAMVLVWTTHRGLTLVLAIGTLLSGLLPAAIAWVGKELVDAIVLASRTTRAPASGVKAASIAASIRSPPSFGSPAHTYSTTHCIALI